MLPFTPEELNTALAEGRVTVRTHPALPLYIYNYAPEIQYTQQWDNVTRACRGLILDEEDNIVARPWEKFFNLGQVNLPIQFDDPVEVMDKADGSLGILYPTVTRRGGGKTHTEYAIATRGSFESEQAKVGTTIWRDYYANADIQEAVKQSGMTFLFEIIYPENRIVLDYGDTQDLILLGAVGTKSGYYYGPREAASFIDWDGPVVEVMPYSSISEALGHTDRKNAEGFVIRSHNFMVKVKQPDYIELHRLVTNASPKTVWEQLKAGKSKSEIISAFPDEFHDYIGGMVDPLVEAFNNRLVEIMNNYNKVYAKVPAFASRKDYALAFKGHKDGKYFFSMLDNRPIRDSLWAELKPKMEVGHDQREEADSLAD